MQKNKYLSLAAAVGLAASLTLVLPVLAATSVAGGQGWGGSGGMHRGSGMGVFGTVSAVSGNTLTVTEKMRPNETSTVATVYTVDASSAKIYKDSATSTVSISSIATGDTVMVQGAVSGSNVTATVIRDGAERMMGGDMPGGKGFGHGTSTNPNPEVTSAIKGNGEPVIGGSVTAINGASLTVTNASNVTYTIDATSATIVKNGTSSSISSIATGDSVIVQGTVNGTAVTASSVIDQGVKGNPSSPNASSSNESHGGGFGFGGIFGAIGGFFQHLFGF